MNPFHTMNSFKYLMYLSIGCITLSRGWTQPPEDVFVCSAQEHNERLLEQMGIQSQDLENRIQYLIQHKRQQEKLLRQQNGWAAQEEKVLTVPLVIHLMFAEKFKNRLGEGGNLTDASIHNTMEELNRYFRKNSFNIDHVLDKFKGVTVDTKIEFVLARRDPEGFPTTGILRTILPEEYVGRLLNNDIDTQAKIYWSPYWDPARYVNIYVVARENMGEGLGGWAYYPMGNLNGLGGSRIRGRKNGGIYLPAVIPIIAMSAEFMVHEGASTASPLAHELGHYFGLVHTFGDGTKDCEEDDYCEDTPLQNAKTGHLYDCEVINSGRYGVTCGSQDMFQNIMAYSNNACQMIFTHCQKERMRTIIQYSVERNTLPGADVKTPLPGKENNVGLAKLKVPLAVCKNTFSIQASIGNYGTNRVESCEIELYVDGAFIRKDAFDLSNNEKGYLGPNEKAMFSIELDRQSSTALQEEVEARIVKVNGQAVQNTSNGIRQIEVRYPRTESTFPIKEDFEKGFVRHWTMDSVTRRVVRFQAIDSEDTVLTFPFAELDGSQPNESWGYHYAMYSPVLPVKHPEGKVPALRIPYSYTARTGHFMDAMMVTVIENPCKANAKEYPIGRRGNGPDLATSKFSLDNTLPELNEWGESIFYLHGNWEEADNFLIGLYFINGGGSNLYLNDLTLSYLPAKDKAHFSVLNVPEIICDEVDYSAIRVDNPTNDKRLCVERVYIKINNNRGVPYTLNYLMGNNSTHCISAYKNSHMYVPHFRFSDGQPQAQVQSYATWYQDASDATYDTAYYSIAHVYSAGVQRILPLENNFSEEKANWLLKGAGTSKKPIRPELWRRTEEEDQAYIKGAFYKSNTPSSHMLLAPLVNYRYADKVSLSFKVSYASRPEGAEDRLRVVVLKGCDIYSGTLVYDKSGSDLQTSSPTEDAWRPSSESHWRTETIDLLPYAKKGPIQVLFIANNNGGNHLYIDDVKYEGEMPAMPLIASGSLLVDQDGIKVYPNPSRDVLTVELPDQLVQGVQVSLMSEDGGLLHTHPYPIDDNKVALILPEDASGTMYFLRIEGDHFRSVHRIILE